MSNLPLAGVRVLDLSRLLPGPMCTMHLADLGADVVKIEDPGRGDYARWSGQKQKVNGPFFLALNRNKRSVALDLRKPAGRDLFLTLAATADVVVESFRPGVLDRMGCGWKALSAVNSRLILCSVTGFGQTGPLSRRAGHDLNFLAAAGVSDQTGAAGGPPVLTNFQIGDLAGGALSACMGVLAALLDARASGRGRHVDVSMTDAAMTHMVLPLAAMASGGRSKPRGADRLTGARPDYGYYETADGRYMAVGAVEPQFWRGLCEALGRPDLIDRQTGTPEETAATRAALSAVFASRTMAEWVATFDDVDCCVNAVLTPDEAAASPHAQARGLVRRDPHPVEGDVLQYAFPIPMTGCDFTTRRPAPMLGEHTLEALGEAWGETPDPSDERLAALLNDGVVAVHHSQTI